MHGVSDINGEKVRPNAATRSAQQPSHQSRPVVLYLLVINTFLLLLKRPSQRFCIFFSFLYFSSSRSPTFIFPLISHFHSWILVPSFVPVPLNCFQSNKIARPFVGLPHTTGMKRVQFFIVLLLLKIGQRIKVKGINDKREETFSLFLFSLCLV